MPSYSATHGCPSFQQALDPFLIDPSLPFADVLPATAIDQVFTEEGVSFGTSSRAIYTPPLVLWAFLSQVLSPGKSCRAAVYRVIVFLASLEREANPADTAAYCRARAKLPERVLERLTLDVSDRLEAAVPRHWQWRGRRVFLVDGFTVTLPDTPANQAAYPQSSAQQPGLGYPLLRLVVLVSLATATVHGVTWGPYQGKETGEPALFRQLLDRLQPGDVVVADRYYCSYFLIVLLQARGVQVVFRLHQRRSYDFRRGCRLASGDHLVTWHKPARPTWMDEELYQEIPATLTVREIRRSITAPGCRTKQLVIATTLLDAMDVTAADVATLYHKRWQVELDIRSLKTYLGMDQLRCLTPAMVHKEVWAHVLGYNLVRKVAAQAAWTKKGSPRQVSFTATVQALTAAWETWSTKTAEERLAMARHLLKELAKEVVGARPDRWEPRAVKRRPKPYPRLQLPRAVAKARLAHGQPRTT
jgi:putative transposase